MQLENVHILLLKTYSFAIMCAQFPLMFMYSRSVSIDSESNVLHVTRSSHNKLSLRYSEQRHTL